MAGVVVVVIVLVVAGEDGCSHGFVVFVAVVFLLVVWSW